MNQTTININEKATMVWNIADILRELYKSHEYGNVILLMIVIKKFHDCLLVTKEKLLEVHKNVKNDSDSVITINLNIGEIF